MFITSGNWIGKHNSLSRNLNHEFFIRIESGFERSDA